MSRVRYHLQGNAEGSTPRRILGILLEEKSGFPLRRVGSGSTTPLPITRLSQVSSLVSAGFTTTVPVNSLPVQRFPLPTLIRWTNQCPDQPDEYLQTGKRCSTNRKPRSAYSAASTLWISATTAAPSPTAAATRLVDPDLTSPIAKTPIRLVSSGNTFGGSVTRNAGKSVIGSVRGNIDDRPELIRGHRFERFPSVKKCAGAIRLHLPVPLVECHLDEWLVDDASRVIDKDIELAERIESLVHRLRRALLARHIS